MFLNILKTDTFKTVYMKENQRKSLPFEYWHNIWLKDSQSNLYEFDTKFPFAYISNFFQNCNCI